MDANVSRGQLKNLVTDRPSPITVKLAQKSDKDNVFKLMDANVSRGQLKNLVTDRPSPITVKLAQKSDKDNVFKLMDANVTRGQMKNLVTDRPSPITVKLAQKQGVPVHVNPVLMRPTGSESEQLGLKLRIGPDDVEVEKRKAQATATQQLSQVSLNKQMQAYCQCKRSLAQKKEEPAAAPEGEKKADAGNATAGNGTNATEPVKEVNLEDLKCNKPKGADHLECKLEEQTVTVKDATPKEKNGTAGNATEGAKEGEKKEGDKAAKEGDKKEGEAEPAGTPVKLPIKVTAPPPAEDGNSTAPAEGDKKAASKEEAASLMQKMSVQTKAQALYKQVEAYCKCMRSHNFVQVGKKDDGVSNTAVTDATCKPVNGVKGVDCTMSGLNVTIEALKNIVTDKPAPLTVPLTYPYHPYVPVAVIPVPVATSDLKKKPANSTFVQFTGDAGEEPDKDPVKNPESPKDTANSAYGDLVDIEAK